jgi:hypothetical protein
LSATESLAHEESADEVFEMKFVGSGGIFDDLLSFA